jgi:hypothetical protein
MGGAVAAQDFDCRALLLKSRKPARQPARPAMSSTGDEPMIAEARQDAGNGRACLRVDEGPARRLGNGGLASPYDLRPADKYLAGAHPAIEKFVAKSPLGAEGAHCGAPLDCIR